MLHKTNFNMPIKQNLRKIQFFCCFCLFISGSITLKAQQEPMYTQYMFNMVQLNPAYAGNRTVDNITNMYRMQWLNVAGAPTTSTLSWDRRQEGTNIGYGLQIYNDKLGVENTSGVQGFYSYRLPFRDSYLSFGLSAGALYYRAAYSQVNTTDPNDNLYQEDVKKVLPTAGFGIMYGSEKWYLGFSVPALLQTKVLSDGRTGFHTLSENHYFLTGGYVFDINENFQLKPSVLMKSLKGAPVEFDYNMNAWLNKVVGFGLSYRTGDAVVGMFEVQVNPKFRLGYAYDFTISNLNTYTKWGTHELMLRYEFGRNQRTQRILSPRYY
jgi:type IX secretion system PorP/SprF family membrane protein